jgi:hypothetical protein
MIKERQVILIDPENLTGDGHLTPAETAWLTQVLPGALDIQRDDLIFVGGDRHNAFELDTIAKALGGRIAFGTGKDGGDRALVAEFDKIPDTALLAKRKGRQVFTIGTWRGISAELAKHSDTCLRLPPMSPDTIDA